MAKAAAHFEAIKYSLRQSKDGVVVSFVIQPEDVRPELMALPIGSRVMIAWSAIGDDEREVRGGSGQEPVQGRVGTESNSALPAAPETKERKPFHTLPLAQQCAIRCEDAMFQSFLANTSETWNARRRSDEFKSLSVLTANTVREILCVGSRSELGKGNHAADNAWRKLNAEYEAWELDQRYADVRR